MGARLPLQIQLFAEEPGEAGADTNTEGAAGSTGADLCDCRYGEKSSRLHFCSCKAFISVARLIACTPGFSVCQSIKYCCSVA